MTYYKDNLNQVYAYSEIQTPKAGIVKMTAKEVEAHINPAPTAEEVKAQRASEIETRLNAIDLETIRPLRAIADGTAKKLDTDTLKNLEKEAEELRTEFRRMK